MIGAAPRGPILLLDDDPDTVHITTEALIAQGYDVEGYVDPHAALERLQRAPVPSLAILDYWMPQMTGAEVVRALRAAGTTIPVLMTTAARLRDIDRGVLDAVGIAVVLTKPYGLRRLIDIIEAHTGRPSEHRGGTT